MTDVPARGIDFTACRYEDKTGVLISFRGRPDNSHIKRAGLPRVSLICLHTRTLCTVGHMTPAFMGNTWGHHHFCGSLYIFLPSYPNENNSWFRNSHNHFGLKDPMSCFH